MTRKKSIATAPILLLAVMVLFGLLQPAFAAKDANNMPVTVRIPVEYHVDGDASSVGTDTYVLTAEETDDPMPEGALNGVKKIRIAEPGKTDFGEMLITKPGAYDYTVHRIASEKENVIKDSTVYHVRIAALNTGEANLIIKRSGEGDKSELIYKDTVKRGFFHSPKTGDPIDPVILIMICAIAAVIILFLLVRMRSRKMQQPRS